MLTLDNLVNMALSLLPATFSIKIPAEGFKFSLLGHVFTVTTPSGELTVTKT